MIGQISGQVGTGGKHSPEERWEKRVDPEYRRTERRARIEGLHAAAREGLWRVLIFVSASTLAACFRDADLFAGLSQGVRVILGDPPPIFLIHLILAVSILSALILIAGRVTGDAVRGTGWLQSGMLCAFYPLYALTGELEMFFPLVFSAGMLVLTLDYVAAALETARIVREERGRQV